MNEESEKFVQQMKFLADNFGFLLPFLSLGKIQFLMARDMLEKEDKLTDRQKQLFKVRLTELIDSADGLIKIVKGEEFPDDEFVFDEN